MAASRQNNESYGPKTDEMAVFGPFFVYDSGNEGESGQGKENQRQLGRTAAETGRKDGWKRERGDERVGGEEEIKRETGIGKEGDEKRKEEDGDWIRERRGLEKRETGIGKEGEEEGKRGSRGLEKREKRPDNVQLTV